MVVNQKGVRRWENEGNVKEIFRTLNLLSSFFLLSGEGASNDENLCSARHGWSCCWTQTTFFYHQV
jgi:uncharacterized protein YjlB